MKAEDFNKFFEQLHGYSPFPWQSRLAKKVALNGWPDTLDLPTSAGKTAALDIALFTLALDAEKKLEERKVPRRIFFVVDRRLIVDEAFLRSERIAKKLQHAYSNEEGILSEVAKRLASLTDGKNPLDVIRLRGGLPRERAFIRNPLQPTIILSTVDQVGSRLLFRGYGVSEFMRPIHAALVGLDSLIILDEAHISQPFMDTLKWVMRYRMDAWAEQAINTPFSLVYMTATPPLGNEIFSLEKEDWTDKELRPRLTCEKLASLVEIKMGVKGKEYTQEKLAKTLVEESKMLMEEQRKKLKTPVVGIIANRVNIARGIFKELRHEKDADAILLTGRTRPYERDTLLHEYLKRMKAGRLDAANPHPLYVVATQTIEVGADIDFNALVTEAAPLDALRQRFGRLNRLGRNKSCEAVIVFDKSAPKDDLLYGEAPSKTWKWLNQYATKNQGRKKRKVFDFGISAMDDLLSKEETIIEMQSPCGKAPVLMPAHVNILVQTSPPPAVEPDVACYLHGINSRPDDVRLIWRADLPELKMDKEEEASVTISLMPPLQSEALSLPVWAVRALLTGSTETEVSDIEGGKRPGEKEDIEGQYTIRWHGPEDSSLIRPKEIRPGDTLVIPSSYGGLDRFGWNPDLKESVVDIADEVTRKVHDKVILRIHPSLISNWSKEDETNKEVKRLLQNAIKRLEEDGLKTICGDLINDLLEMQGLNPAIRKELLVLKANRREKVYPSYEAPQGILLQGKHNKAPEFTDEDDSSSLIREISLEEHCKGVAEMARSFALGCGLTDVQVNDIEIVGTLHDLGKADPRFQAWLRNGNRMSVQRSTDLLAKSSMAINDRNGIRLARERAGYPKGTRHECYSVAIAKQCHAILKRTNDSDLVSYLVGTHHGRGRPFMPAIDDEGMITAFNFMSNTIEFKGQHNLEKLSEGWADRFWRLNRRYGYWGLAYLETIVRLADHRQSGKETLKR